MWNTGDLFNTYIKKETQKNFSHFRKTTMKSTRKVAYAVCTVHTTITALVFFSVHVTTTKIFHNLVDTLWGISNDPTFWITKSPESQATQLAGSLLLWANMNQVNTSSFLPKIKKNMNDSHKTESTINASFHPFLVPL